MPFRTASTAYIARRAAASKDAKAVRKAARKAAARAAGPQLRIPVVGKWDTEIDNSILLSCRAERNRAIRALRALRAAAGACAEA